MRILLLTPPMTQLNTPYPATSYLAGFLRGRGYDAVQDDLSIRLALRLFSEQGVRDVAEVTHQHPSRHTNASVAAFDGRVDATARAMGPAVRFLQGRDDAVAYRIISGRLLPEGPRFDALDRFDDEQGITSMARMIRLSATPPK